MYKRQLQDRGEHDVHDPDAADEKRDPGDAPHDDVEEPLSCLLYTSDAADERSSVDLGGRRIIKKKKHIRNTVYSANTKNTRHH